MKKVLLFSFCLVLIMSGCSSNASNKNEKGESIIINSKDKTYEIVDKFSEKPKKIEVFKLGNDNSKNITNNGLVKKRDNKISWIGTPDKYDDLKDLLGDSFKYEVTLEDDSKVEKEITVKYK